MKRSPLRRSTGEARATSPVYRPRCCDKRKGGCGEMFYPARSMQKACGPRCASAMVDASKAKDAAKAKAEDKRKTRAQLEALKTIPQLKKEAQREFNRYIRIRDRLAGWSCICCGRALEWGTTGITGSAVDAGHYRSTGSADHLRFDERNCHAQRSDCNRHGAGRAVDYRIGLIARIGSAEVAALEANNTPVKWTRDQLREIRDKYRRLARELERKQ